MRQVREHRDALVERLPRLRLVCVAAMVVIAATYWFVQVVEGEVYREMADNNRLRAVPVKAPRGLIYDRTGRLLVENVPSYNLLLDRSRSRDLEASLGFVASVLERPVDDFVALERSARGSPFKPILMAEDLSLSEVSRFAVSALEHPEFEIDVGHLRLYRHGPLTAHALGHLGEVSEDDLNQAETPYRAGDLVGKKGVEETFDLTLRGRDGERKVIVDSRGRLRSESSRAEARPGENLELALDLELQQVAARFFEDKVGAAVAMRPKTGEILTLVSAPTYNPNLFARRLDRTSWRELTEAPNDPLQNRTIQNTYSPGSVFKIVVATAGLTEGTVDGDDVVWCGGATRIYNKRFRCWKRVGHGWVNLHKGIKESCDVYFYHLGQKLGIARIAHYARQFGLGGKTGFEVSGEKRGLVPDPEWSLKHRRSPWYPGETISVAIGQGPLLTTPLQIAGLMAVVANGGERVVPRLTRSTGESPAETGLSPGALAAVRQALWAVVNERGTGASARVAGVDVAGKTGTVQVIQQKTWIDSKDLPFEKRDHAWFASYGQVGDDQLAVVVFVEHGGKGSESAAPLAKQLYEVYFRDAIAGAA